MKSICSGLIGLTAMLWLPVAIASGFQISILNSSDLFVPAKRAWLGDGKLYVGDVVPPEIKVAFNFTVRDDRYGLWYVEIDRENSRARVPDLPDPTFLAVNIAGGASDPIWHTHSAVDFRADDIFLFTGAYGFHWPATKDGQAPGSAFMVPVAGTPGTYLVRWVVNADASAMPGAVAAQLSSR